MVGFAGVRGTEIRYRGIGHWGKGYRSVMGKIIINKNIDAVKEELDAALSAV